MFSWSCYVFFAVLQKPLQHVQRLCFMRHWRCKLATIWCGTASRTFGIHAVLMFLIYVCTDCELVTVFLLALPLLFLYQKSCCLLCPLCPTPPQKKTTATPLRRGFPKPWRPGRGVCLTYQNEMAARQPVPRKVFVYVCLVLSIRCFTIV